MDLLRKFNVGRDMCKDEFVRRLGRGASTDQVDSLRCSLFSSAQNMGLADAGGVLVTRRKAAGGKSIKRKHVDDEWSLVFSIKNKCSVPRVLLKNGKRLKGVLLLSQARETEMAKGGVRDGEGEGMRGTDSGVVSEAEEEEDPLVPGQALGARILVAGASVRKGPEHIGLGSDDVAFRSRLICDLNSLRNDMRDLRSDVAALKRPPPPIATRSPRVGFCFLFVRLLSHSGERLGTTLLERLLNCEILLLKSSPIPSFKVKEAKGVVTGAIAIGRGNGCFVDVWVNRPRVVKGPNSYLY